MKRKMNQPWYTAPYLAPKTEERLMKIQGKKLLFFSSEIQGLRSAMEDASFAHPIQGNCAFAIFDGHGGNEASEYAKENMPSLLEKKLADQPEDAIPELLRTSFLELDAKMMASEDWPKNPGATALVCLMTPTHVHCANAGDSRCVLSSGGHAIDLSNDHKPTLPAEKARIEAAGYGVVFNRVAGSLAVARALGDKYLKDRPDLPAEKQAVTADPEIISRALTPEDEFLILACDGIWDVISSQDLVNLIRAKICLGLELKEITRLIHQHCLRERSRDNMSISIIALTDSITNQTWLDRCRGPVILEGGKVFDPAQDFHVGRFPTSEDEEEEEEEGEDPPQKKRQRLDLEDEE